MSKFVLKVPKKTNVTDVSIGNYCFDFSAKTIETSNADIARILCEEHGCKLVDQLPDNGDSDEAENTTQIATENTTEVTEDGNSN